MPDEDISIRGTLGIALAATVCLGGTIVVAGCVLIYLGATGHTDIDMFGAKVSTGSVGAVAIICGTLVAVLNVRNVLRTIENVVGVGRVRREQREAERERREAEKIERDTEAAKRDDKGRPKDDKPEFPKVPSGGSAQRGGGGGLGGGGLPSGMGQGARSRRVAIDFNQSPKIDL